MKARFHRDDCGCAAPTTCCQPSCGSCCDTCDSPGFFARMKGRFHRGGDCGCESSCSSCSSCGSGGTVVGPHYPGMSTAPWVMPKAGEPIPGPKDGGTGKPMPNGTIGGKDGGKEVRAPAPLDLSPTATRPADKETKNPFELDRRYESRVNRAADYSWVTGQLSYVHADGGLWVLRYAPLGEEDPNGGSIVLARGRSMDSYREGDVVKVRGEIISPRASPSLGGPLYRAQVIELIDRSAK
jgi:hypothetical protein